MLVPLPFGLARIQARFLQMLPKPLLTVDQVEMLKVDNVVSVEAEAEGRTLKALGIAIKLTWRGSNQLHKRETYLLTVTVALCIATQMNYLNKATRP